MFVLTISFKLKDLIAIIITYYVLKMYNIFKYYNNLQ